MNKPMTKVQLVAAVAEKAGCDKKAAEAVIAAIAAVVIAEVAAGGAVTLPNLCKISCRARPERVVRNPATGAQMVKAAGKKVGVTVVKALKECVGA